MRLFNCSMRTRAIAAMAVAAFAVAPAAAGGTGVSLTLTIQSPLPLLTGLLCNTVSQSLPFVTTYDPDGAGPAAPQAPRLTQVHATVTSLLGALCQTPVDVNGDGVPDLGVSIYIPATDNISNPQHPVIQVRKLVAGTLPVKAELIEPGSGGTNTSIGYDQLASSAPDTFIATIDLSDRDHNSATSQTAVNLQLAGSAPSLTLVNDVFTGPPAGTRTAVTSRRLTYRGSSANGTAVPSAPTIDVTQGPGSKVDVKLHTSQPTTLDFALTAPNTTPVSGTLDREPTDVEVTSRQSVDGDQDGTVDDQVVDYRSGTTSSPGERVGTATIKIGTDAAGTVATVKNLPSAVSFAYTALPAGATAHYYGASALADSATVKVIDGKASTTATLNKVPTDVGVTYVTTHDGLGAHYKANGRASSGAITVTDGVATTSATLVNVPSDITVNYATGSSVALGGPVICDPMVGCPTGGGGPVICDPMVGCPTGTTVTTVHYAANSRGDSATLAADDGHDTTSSATITSIPETVDVVYDSSAGGGYLHLLSDNGTAGTGPARAHVEVHDPQGQVATMDLPKALSPASSNGLPSDLAVEYSKTTGKLHFTYTANAVIADGEIHLLNSSSLPNGAKDLGLVLTGIPTKLTFDSSSSSSASSSTAPVLQPNGPTCADANYKLPGCKCPLNPPAGCKDGPPPIETRAVKSDSSDSEISVTAPNEPLGSGELQMTSGPQDRLPDASTSTGDPEDGVLLYDLGNSYDLFARVTDFHSFDLKQHADNKVAQQLAWIQPDIDYHHGSTHLAFDATPSGHTLAFDERSGISGTQVNYTNAQVDVLPPDMVLDTKTSSDPDEHGFSDLNFTSGSVADPGGLTYQEEENIANDPAQITTKATVFPMPTSLHVCKAAETPVCAGGTFDQNIVDIRTHGAQYKCFPSGGDCLDYDIAVDPNDANQGSVLMTADPAVSLHYTDTPFTSGPSTQIDFAPLTRFVLQADETTGLCDTTIGDDCKTGYLGLDTGDQDIQGGFEHGVAGAETSFYFPTGFKALDRVFGFHQTSPVSGALAVDGGVLCPAGTGIGPGGEDITNRFCYGALTG